MQTSTMIAIAVTIIAGLAILYIISYLKDKKNEKKLTTEKPKDEGQTNQLKLQAYERMVILADRIALPNLINRVNQPGLSKSEMQQLLTQTIRQEFEYNLSQQIYVSPAAWDAVRNLKEQNILIVNQIASIIPPTASSTDLNKHVIEFVMNQPQGSMHTMVQEALSYEAKKVM